MNYYLIKIALLMMTAISSTTTANTIDGVKSSATSSPISFTLPRGGYSAFLKKKDAISTSPKNAIPKQKISSKTSSNHPLLSSESAIKAAITRANRLNNHESSA